MKAMSSSAFELLSGIARRQEHTDTRPQSPRFTSEVDPVHAIRHNDVREQDVDRRAPLQDREGFRRIRGRVNLITKEPKRLGRDRKHVRIVFGDEDRTHLVARIRSLRDQSREKNSYRGATPKVRVDLDLTARLPGEPVNLAQAQPGP